MSAEKVVLEGTLVGFVEEIRIEYDRGIGSIGDLHRLGAHLYESGENPRLVLGAVVLLKIPVLWHRLVEEDWSVGLLVEVGLVRGNQKVHVDRCSASMDVEPAARTIVFEGPNLGESMLLEDARCLHLARRRWPRYPAPDLAWFAAYLASTFGWLHNLAGRPLTGGRY